MIKRIFCLFCVLTVLARSQAFLLVVATPPKTSSASKSTFLPAGAATRAVSEDTATHNNGNRRQALEIAAGFLLLVTLPTDPAAAAGANRIDVNNALAREYTAFPGVFPTIATKIVKGGPYTSKKEVYAVLNELEQDRLKGYDQAIVINKVDAQLKQFKTSQICKYECGNRVSSAYRDDQIKAVQKARRGYDD